MTTTRLAAHHSPHRGDPHRRAASSAAMTPPLSGRRVVTRVAAVVALVAPTIARGDEPAVAPPAEIPAEPALTVLELRTELATELFREETVKKAAAEKEEKEGAQRQFAGINFGVAIGVLVPVYRNTRIEEAVLVPSDPANPDAPKVVRATVRRSVDARLLLETHYFFQADRFPLFGWGPVIIVQPGTDEIVEGAGLGAMVGWRRGEKTSESFNLGLALFMERSVKDLGEGIEEDKPLPAGETEIRYQQKPAVSVVLLGSFSF